MEYRRFSVRSSPDDFAGLVMILEEIYTPNISVEESCGLRSIKLYFGKEKKSREVKEEIIKRLEELGLDNIVFDIAGEIIDEEKYLNEWRKHFRTQRVGERLVIKFPFDEEEIDDDRISILIEPGFSFGTGLHPTTRDCLFYLERLDPRGRSVLDVGTGTGILAIGAFLLGADRVTAIDYDAEAVENARENEILNGIKGKIDFILRDIKDIKKGSFDIIMANLDLKTFGKHLKRLYKISSPADHIFSGILKERSFDFKKKVTDTGFCLVDMKETGGWCTYLINNYE